ERALESSSPATRPLASAARLSATRRDPPLPGATRTSGRWGSTASAGEPAAVLACACRRRAIGQDLSQTETMRDMVPLDQPAAGMAVAAAFERQVPSTECECAEAVSTG